MDEHRGAGTVAITGAGSGIGLAAALHYAGQGWRVGLIGRGEAALETAARKSRERGAEAHVARADVADAAALGAVDVWVNNAGIGFYGIRRRAGRGVPPSRQVNLFGTVNGTRTALARMRPRNRGTIKVQCSPP